MTNNLKWQNNKEEKSSGRGRYAPSPTGQLHLGNMQTALVAWLHARLSEQEYLLRIEDLDFRRCHKKYSHQIIEDLSWLGLEWDMGPGRFEPGASFFQSQRTDLYQEALEYLAESNRLFTCYCTRKELGEDPSSTPGRLGLIYPGHCRCKLFKNMSDLESNSVSDFSIKMKVGCGELFFYDQIYGPQKASLADEIGDFVVYRKDNVFAYHLAVVVDDIAQGVTDVVRGADLLDSVFPQQVIYQALGAPLPNYWHMPLREDAQGEKLSKRDNAPALAKLRDEGKTAEQIIALLANGLGLIESYQDSISLQELLQTHTVESLQLAIKKCL